jgi:hypothetical protein
MRGGGLGTVEAVVAMTDHVGFGVVEDDGKENQVSRRMHQDEK